MKKLLFFVALVYASAIGATSYGLWLNDTQMTSANCSFLNGKIAYNAATNVLTINNVNDTASLLFVNQDVTLKFVGNTTLGGIFQNNPDDVYTITIKTEGNAKLTLPHESTFYVNDFIVIFKNCNFTLENSSPFSIRQATLFAGEIILEGCTISNPTRALISEIPNTGYYTITDNDGDFMRTITTRATEQETPDVPVEEDNGLVTLSTSIFGSNTSSSNVVVADVASQESIRKCAIIRNSSNSAKLEMAKKIAEDIFSSEMTRMRINLPDPITAIVEFGESSQFDGEDEICKVDIKYLDEMPAHFQYYPHIGESDQIYTNCLYPLSLVNLANQGEYLENEPCMTLYINPDNNYYYGEDPNGIASDQYDMVSVILRGLVVGCGFQSSFAIGSDGKLTIGEDHQGNKYLTAFDAFLHNGLHDYIADYVWKNRDIYTFLDTNVYGPRSVELHNDLRTCPTCVPTTATMNTISFEDENNDSIELMFPTLYKGTVVRKITHNTEEILHGLGWQFDVVVDNDEYIPQGEINGSAVLRANNNYTFNATGDYISANMSCNLFCADSTYVLASNETNNLQVLFSALPDNDWRRNPLNNRIMGRVKAEENISVNGRTVNVVSTLPIEIPYKPNLPVCEFVENESGNALNVSVKAFSDGSDKYVVTCTPITPGISTCDTIEADMLDYVVQNLSPSKQYSISVAGLNSEGKSTAVHKLVGNNSTPLTMHVTTSTNYITYYFRENGSAAPDLEIASVKITDLSGVLIQNCNAAQNEQIDISALTSQTVYLLVVTLADGRQFSKQFMKL